MKSRLASTIVESPYWLPFPICTQVGAQLIGASVKEMVCNAQIQAEAILALQEYLDLQIIMTAMDLSIEAEMYGCEVAYSETEIPTVMGKRIRSPMDISELPTPQPGDGRSYVSLETIKKLLTAHGNTHVLGCIIGPFSLAVRLLGASEALELTVTEPHLLETLLEKILLFQINYAKVFRYLGASGILIAEPAAGLLSPRAMSRFSSAYIRELISAVSSDDFSIILHNCGAKPVHLPAILEATAEIYHFGTPMDLQKALTHLGDQAVLAGNLDPYETFVVGFTEDVAARTYHLVETVNSAANFIPSSGCDLPSQTPLQNLKIFIETLKSIPKKVGGHQSTEQLGGFKIPRPS